MTRQHNQQVGFGQENQTERVYKEPMVAEQPFILDNQRTEPEDENDCITEEEAINGNVTLTVFLLSIASNVESSSFL